MMTVFSQTQAERLRPAVEDEKERCKHLLLFWPLFGIIFLFLERGVHQKYYVMHCALDNSIPFCEYFLIPYLFWFVFMIGMLIYSYLHDTETFKRYMQFIILTYSAACVVFILFPTMQELRPIAFTDHNIFTWIISAFYKFDTNTNVCPSLHVIGSMAVLFAAWHSKRFSTPRWRIAFSIATFLICISTVFLKQHSLLDLPPAVLICVAAYWFVYRRKPAAEPIPSRY